MKTDTPIAQQFLDNDFYCFTMGNAFHKGHGKLKVRYAFTNRNKTFPLADYLNMEELKEELAAFSNLYLTKSEFDYLRGQGIFSKEYLNYLRGVKLPHVEVENWRGQLVLGFEGEWGSAIFAEVPCLYIVTELLYRRLMKDRGITPEQIQRAVRERTEAKLQMLSNYPEIRFLLMGARRRFSAEVERQVTEQVIDTIPGQLVGTSTVSHARYYGLPARGTQAHQLYMVLSALEMAQDEERGLARAQDLVLDMWEDAYLGKWENRLLTALPDTYGTEFFLRNFQPERAKQWFAMRQDSGNPASFYQRVLDYYWEHDIDPKQHMVTPSDGMTPKTMLELYTQYRGRVNSSFGWGSNLANDTGYFSNFSLVIKPEVVEGKYPCVKLSDNVEKAIGPVQEVKRYMNAAGYHAVPGEKPRY